MNSVEEVLIHMKQVLIEEPFKVRVRQDAEIPTPKAGEAFEALRHNSGNLMKVVLKAAE